MKFRLELQQVPLIDSILKANDKGKIKVKKIEDNTSAEAEIIIHLSSGVSPDKTIDALYAFTDCEVSISPNSSIIDNEKPVFLGVSEILRANTDQTVFLLKRELEIKLAELESQWHFATLEKIFIQKEMYIDFKNMQIEKVCTNTSMHPLSLIKSNSFVRLPMRTCTN